MKPLAEGKPADLDLGVLRLNIPAVPSADDKRPGTDTALDYSSFMPNLFQEVAGSQSVVGEPAISWRAISIKPPSSLSRGIFQLVGFLI